jgi:ATP-dependent helicase/nuclease subunit A
MEPPRTQNDSLTTSQRQAVAARGNVLVMAGAGTGKTHTLVERCLDCLRHESPPASLDELLVVTFTDAAAVEVRRRIRRGLEKEISTRPGEEHWAKQLALFDTAPIGTLHSFCLKLVREHFYELGLDPQLAVLDAGEARLLAEETLDEQFQAHYAGQTGHSVAAQNLIQIYGNGDERPIRAMLLRLHHYAQTRPDASRWLAEQIARFASPEPVEWREWLGKAITGWREEWLPVLENLGAPASGAPAANEKAAELAAILSRLGNPDDSQSAPEVLRRIISADGNWPPKRKTVLRKPLEDFFADAAFLQSLLPAENSRDPLAEDWDWIRGHMGTLLQLAQEFGEGFANRKRADGVLDFHDLEQFALKLLWNSSANKPTAAAEHSRKNIRFVFVDEYQDINAAQDKIIQALGRDEGWGEPAGEPSKAAGLESTDGSRERPPHRANRFLVGDVKQSIYRFRLADPTIFRRYADEWHGKNGRVIPLTENFRSREGLLGFVNSVFELLMRAEVGGVDYDAGARLQFGAPEHRAALGLAQNPSPRAEWLLRFKGHPDDGPADNESGDPDLAELEESGKEARLVAHRLRELLAQNYKIWDEAKAAERAVEWRDMAVLLRAPANKAEAYAKEFERAGVPLVVERGGFYDSVEIADLLSLLRLLDNPLQDVPAIAVLRSPLAGLSLDELAAVRLAAKDVRFWTALNRIQNPESRTQNVTTQKVEQFLERFHRWRQLARQASLSQCLENVLAETHYAEWLRSRPRGAQRQANVERFLGLAQQFDQFQRQGLFRFLKFIEGQQAAEAEPDVAAVASENAVRLMSIHQSKGLEFPVVVVADLAKPFNEQDLRGEIIFDEQFGLCPRVKPPHTGRRYPSLPHWLAQRHQRREQRGEELRLLYVAMTRARDTLILTATLSEKKRESLWLKPQAITNQTIVGAKSYADWLGLWFGVRNSEFGVQNSTGGELPHLRWRVVEDAELSDPSAIGHRPPAMEWPALNQETKQRLHSMLTWEYGFDAATQRAAKSSVTALRRQAEELDDESEQIFVPRDFAPTAARGTRAKLSAAATGTAHHKFLQHVTLAKADDLAALTAETGRLETAGVLTAAERAALDLEAVAAFWKSEPGRKIRAQTPDCIRRELAFTAKFSPAEVDDIIGKKTPRGLAHEFVVVQGVADLVVLLPREIWLVDFKTDGIKPGELTERKRLYEPQLKLYAGALSRIYSHPVTNCWLHFLAARQTANLKI